jgi:hypothetical protein
MNVNDWSFAVSITLPCMCDASLSNASHVLKRLSVEHVAWVCHACLTLTFGSL